LEHESDQVPAAWRAEHSGDAVISLCADRRDIAAGARAMVPWLAGIVPFGLVIGVSAAQADIPTLAGWLTGPLIYAGSSQVATIGMLDAGAAPVVVVASALIINIRLVFYSATMARYWRGTPWWWRLVAAYLMVDPSVAVGLDGYQRLGRGRGHAHYLGGAVVLWVSWLAAITVGAVVGAGLPAWLHLEFVIPLYLVGQAISKLANPAQRRAILAAASVALLTLSAPLQLGIALAIAVGITAGLTVRPDEPGRSPRPLQPTAEVRR
jgi:predicted branched-subunit amino acid permease